MGAMSTLLALIFALPAITLGLFLEYLVLKHVAATELMWFVFIIHVPVVVMGVVAAKVADGSE